MSLTNGREGMLSKLAGSVKGFAGERRRGCRARIERTIRFVLPLCVCPSARPRVDITQPHIVGCSLVQTANVQYTTTFYDHGDPLAGPESHLHLQVDSVVHVLPPRRNSLHAMHSVLSPAMVAPPF